MRYTRRAQPFQPFGRHRRRHDVVQLPRHEQAAAKEVRAVVAATVGKESTALRAIAREMVDRRIGESAEDFAREGARDGNAKSRTQRGISRNDE
jgi:hypothetical protein